MVKLLMVEDNEMNRDMLSRRLARKGYEVIRAVDANQRVLQTGSMQRSSHEFRTACELVRNGVIGEISEVFCQFGDPGIPCDLPEEAPEPGLDWDLWLGPAPVRPYHSVLSPRGIHDHFPNWRDYREFGGGMVTDWGAHLLDGAQWGNNTEHTGPVEVEGKGKFFKDGLYNTAYEYDAICYFP